MLSRIFDATPEILVFSARDHARILEAHHDKAANALKRDDWTCHVCKTRIPEFMEIDHGNRHNPECDELKAICQICHNLHHPVWAASRGRMIFIHAPEFTQAQINRFAWAMLSLRGYSSFPWDESRFMTSISERRQVMENIIGSRTAESFFEAARSMGARVGEDIARKTLMDLDQVVRVWPAEVMPDHGTLPAASRLSTWTIGGFRTGAKVGSRLLRDSLETNPDSLKVAARHAMKSGKEKTSP